MKISCGQRYCFHKAKVFFNDCLIEQHLNNVNTTSMMKRIVGNGELNNDMFYFYRNKPLSFAPKSNGRVKNLILNDVMNENIQIHKSNVFNYDSV